MTDFVNIEQEEEQPIVTSSYSVVQDDIPQISLDPIIPDIPTTDEESICVSKECSTQTCQDDSGYFKVDNLFSELITEYQKNQAKNNLGIGTEYDLVWENILGNPKNSSLYSILIDEVNKTDSALVAAFNTTINQVSQFVQKQVSSKGLPGFQYFIMTPMQIDVGIDSNIIQAIWEYDPSITLISQKINNVDIPLTTRTYEVDNVLSDYTLTIDYVYRLPTGQQYTSQYSVTTNVYYPIYYGTTTDISKLSRTRQFPLQVTTGSNEYSYVLCKGDSELSVNGMIGGFTKVGNVVQYNQIYNIYKSSEPNLGTITINKS